MNKLALPMNKHALSTFLALRHYVVLGFVVVIVVVVGIGGWASTAVFSGAVASQGFLVVDSNPKKVQHSSGGTILELRVREGSRVNVGDIVARLDDTQTRAAAQIVAKNLDDLLAQQARLEAERDNIEQIQFPVALSQRASERNSDAARAMIAERQLFALRREAREGQKAQLNERIAQIQQEIQGYVGQTAAKKREIELIEQELTGVRELRYKNLVPVSRLTVLERDGARLEGERNQLMGAIAQSKGKIAEIGLQIIQIDQELRSETSKQLSEVRSKISELVERKVATEDLLKHIDIRAPQSGVVHQLNVHTIGGVISAGETMMLIVPDRDVLVAELRIPPQEIDQIYPGQKAIIRFPALDRQTTPELWGAVSLMSADLTQDQRTGMAYYNVRVTLDDDDIDLMRVKGIKLMPGMPVETFIQTGERTVLTYLTKPLRDQAMRAFIEK